MSDLDPLSEEDHDVLLLLQAHLLCGAATENSTLFGEAVHQLTHVGPAGVYLVAAAHAGTVAHVLNVDVGTVTVGLAAVDQHGTVLDPDDLPPEGRAAAAAARFTTAYLNCDTDTMVALVETVWDAGEHDLVAFLWMLARSTLQTCSVFHGGPGQHLPSPN